MTREIILLRHGKSDWDVDCHEFDRPLKNRGKRGAQKLGVRLQQQQLIPDLIVSSPAQRAINTAEKLCKAMGRSVLLIRKEAKLYDASLEQMLQVISATPESVRRLMLVGHNPGMEWLLQYLAADEIAMPADGKLLPTATLARLTLLRAWQALPRGCGELQEIVRPSTLAEGFPYTTLSGTEMRPRPAYYYTQSEVIPYRWVAGKMQILLISSSSQQHWLVPKGIVEPGLSPQLSAAKEAWEEGGIAGKVADQALGSYEYEKWGAICRVTVFPMLVESTVPDSEWEESHRLRKWVASHAAAAQVREQKLRPLIEKWLSVSQ